MKRSLYNSNKSWPCEESCKRLTSQLKVMGNLPN